MIGRFLFNVRILTFMGSFNRRFFFNIRILALILMFEYFLRLLIFPIRILHVELISTKLSNCRLTSTTCSPARLSSQAFTAVLIDLQTTFLKCKVEFSTLKVRFPRQTNPRDVGPKPRQKKATYAAISFIKQLQKPVEYTKKK